MKYSFEHHLQGIYADLFELWEDIEQSEKIDQVTKDISEKFYQKVVATIEHWHKTVETAK